MKISKNNIFDYFVNTYLELTDNKRFFKSLKIKGSLIGET